MNGITLTLCTIVGVFAVAQGTTAAASTDFSPAAQSMAAANKAIGEKPAEYAGYNLLAMALVRRAEETSDVSFYTRAEDTVRKSLELAPNNFETRKVQVSILLGEHEYPAALEAAKALNKRVPDDVMVYGLLADANVALGNYRDAEDAAQWMLNLRRGNRPALIRAAHLRELFGDVEGAYELMDLAFQSTAPGDTGERAGILTEMGHLRLACGNLGAAETLLDHALTSRPDYPAALESLAQVRIAQKRYEEAVEFLQQRYRAVPRAGNLYDLAEALQLAGRDGEAQRSFAAFETKSLLESDGKDNSNRQLVFYYADQAHQPEKALKIAQQEYAWRHDVYTVDAYAWALAAIGDYKAADEQIQKALQVGVKDPRILSHADFIARHLNQSVSASRN
jgi:tetratricopeptide (TPR) repeat protein